MWKKISASPIGLASIGALACVLAFPPIEFTALLILFPAFFTAAILRSRSTHQAFWCGFAASSVIMAGGFYWVVYVIHVFGDIPWVFSALLYVVFAGLGALNFPLFSVALFRIHRRFPSLQTNAGWYALGVPSLFCVVEWVVPKLFPWQVGHAYYRQLWLIQPVEITGTLLLSFLVFSWGAVAAATTLRLGNATKLKRAITIPIGLSLICIGFSTWRLSSPSDPTTDLQVALIQPNIGSLDKVKAEQGLHGKVQYVVDKYLQLTEQALLGHPKPDLVLWPETAMPFGLGSDYGYAAQVRGAVSRWKVPLISGGYAPGETPTEADYNAAFLLDPTPEGTLKTSLYYKNILLAFGEYFPGGDWIPSVYRWFPQVSHFEKGKTQNLLTLQNGVRIGTTICYEDIVPEFFRKVTRLGVRLVVNLTNDSWFGPTSEPYQHAALSVFRAIESRTPFVRVTNTGVSFAVDRLGNQSQRTPVYEEAFSNLTVQLPSSTTLTLYTRFGDWIVFVFLGLILFFWRRGGHVPVRS